MLPRLLLLVLQVAIAIVAAPWLASRLPVILAQPYGVLVLAIIDALVVFVVGYIGALVLRRVRAPSRATLTVSVLLALAGAALTLVGPAMQPIAAALPPLGAHPEWLALAGAILGYLLKR